MFIFSSNLKGSPSKLPRRRSAFPQPIPTEGSKDTPNDQELQPQRQMSNDESTKNPIPLAPADDQQHDSPPRKDLLTALRISSKRVEDLTLALNSLTQEIEKRTRERYLMSTEIETLNEKLRSCMSLLDSIRQQNTNLKDQNAQFKHEIKTLLEQARKNEADNKQSMLVLENETLKQNIVALQKANEAGNRLTVLLKREKEEKKLRQDIEGLVWENAEGKHLNIQLKHEIRELNKIIGFLREDNERLREYIFKTVATIPRELNSSSDHCQDFREINLEIEIWIVKSARAYAATELTASEETNLLEALSASGVYGKMSSEFLRLRNIPRVWYSRPRTRIQFLRHIVAVFILDNVFEPIVSGLHPDLSRSLSWIENDIMSRGLFHVQRLKLMSESDFEKMLMIRQSLGISIFRCIKEGGGNESGDDISIKLARILRLLLPKCPENNIDRATSKFVAKAIKLKNALAQDPGLYRCHWAQCGAQFDPDMVETHDEGTGLVYLCTFPGLTRIPAKNAAICEIKASAVLQSSDVSVRNISNEANIEKLKI